jgi:diguanylate cyclase (GGDEF)-like protein
LRELAMLVARVCSASNVSIALRDDDGPAWLEVESGSATSAAERIVASAALIASGGASVGSISVFDSEVEHLTGEQTALLQEFATLIVRSYEVRFAYLREREIERYRLQFLELAANDAPLQVIFDKLVECVEYRLPGSLCSLAMPRGGRLYGVSAGRAFPATYLAAIEGLRIGVDQGSCGTAAFRGETVIVEEISSDPLWSQYRELAAVAGLESCWSAPIRGAENAVLGTLAIYHPHAARPTAQDLDFVHEAAAFASVAIESSHSRAKLEHTALHDQLTGLPNRALFEDRMQQAIASAKRTGRRVAVGLMDLARFKAVNDSFGHAIGDTLLTDVSNRLRIAVRPQDTVARMGGDEFLLLMTDLDDRESATSIAERFVAVLEPYFVPGGIEIFVRGSMGVSVFPDDAREPLELVRLADSAMYLAKSSGERVAFYRNEAPPGDASQVDIETSLQSALANREFELYYQPQVCLADGEHRAVEALLRWHHPRAGEIAPERFFPIAEETGLGVTIGAWVLEEACRFARRRLDAGVPHAVWVNVSPRQFEDAGFVDSVAKALAAAHLPPEHLWLEVKESHIMRSPSSAAATLGALRRLGVRTAIDDFGVGYSSLSYLKRFPIGAVKIGPEFLRGIGSKDKGEGAVDEAIVCAILGVGRALGIKVVAEGIETREQLDFLRRNGCELGQGYMFSLPLTAGELLYQRSAVASSANGNPT